MSYEYKVVPAPMRGKKAKGVKTAEDRFANALQTQMNDLAAEGWEYLRADTLPCEQREGFIGKKTTTYQNMLVFRRALAVVAPVAAAPAPVPAPEPAEPPVKLVDTAPAPAEDVAEPALTPAAATADRPRRRTGPYVSRALPAPERLTPELKKELMNVELIDTKSAKSGLAAE